MVRQDAIAAAVRFRNNPAFAATVQSRPLPSGITAAIRIAAHLNEAETAQAAEGLGLDPLELQAACITYLRHALFHAKADDYRILGLAPGATPKQIQEHRRLLLGWLHPDRNDRQWEKPLFRMVTDAGVRLAANPASANIPAAAKPSGAPGFVRKNSTNRRSASEYRGWIIAGARERRPAAASWRRRLARIAVSLVFLLVVAATGIAALDLTSSSRFLQMAWSATPRFLDW